MLERHNLKPLLMREGVKTTKVNLVSMLSRKAGGKRAAIPLIGQGHVLQLAPQTRSVVFASLGGTNTWRDYFVLSIEVGNLCLHATLLGGLEPADSTAFPRRTNIFCRSCSYCSYFNSR